MLFALVCVPVVAQDVVIPENPTDVGWGFETFSALTALVAVIIPFAVEIFKRFIPNVPPLVKQIVTWLIGVAIALIGWLLNLGFIGGVSWYMMVLYGLFAGLVADGVFDTGIVTWLFGLFGMKEK